MDVNLPLSPEVKVIANGLESLWKYINADFEKNQLKNQDDLTIFLLVSFLASFHRIIRAVLSELSSGSVDGLDYLLRPVIESMINIKYILDDKTQMRARAFIVQDIKDRLALIRRIISLIKKNRAPAMKKIKSVGEYEEQEKVLIKELEELTEEYGEENLKLPPLEQRANLAGTEEVYATSYWLSSLDAHQTIRSLDRYLSAEGSSITLSIGQDLSRVKMNLETFFIAYLSLLNECNERLGFFDKTVLKKYDEKLSPKN